MYADALKHLRCINCDYSELSTVIARQNNGNIEEGALRCLSCRAEYQIYNSIPRFVKTEGYCESFGLEWNIHNRTQYDSHSHKIFSKTRFFAETGWPKDLSGEVIIEVGCGSGRFTEWALNTGACVFSFDLSHAVEANQKNNGSNKRLLIAQADIYNMPFKKEYADKLFCFGVLQHTPDPKKALFSLLPYVKRKGGEIIFDIYEKKLHMKYFIRGLFKNIRPKTLYRFCKDWIDFMWPIATLMRKISKTYGPKINWQLMIADYSREGLSGGQLKEWAYLDTFDMLSPRFDLSATIKEVKDWLSEFKKLNMIDDFAVKRGYNGIEGKIFR